MLNNKIIAYQSETLQKIPIVGKIYTTATLWLVLISAWHKYHVWVNHCNLICDTICSVNICTLRNCLRKMSLGYKRRKLIWSHHSLSVWLCFIQSTENGNSSSIKVTHFLPTVLPDFSIFFSYPSAASVQQLIADGESHLISFFLLLKRLFRLLS